MSRQCAWSHICWMKSLPRIPGSPSGFPGALRLGADTHVADRPGHDQRYALSNRKIQLDLGFEPAEPFETGIRKTIAWYLAREDWWREVMDGSYREWMRKQYGPVVSF
jgi:hypothetical protein